MPKRSYVEILIEVLKREHLNQASRRRIAEVTGWSLERVERVVEANRFIPGSGIWVGRGGLVQHRNTEKGASNGLYVDVARIVTNFWGPRHFGLRDITVIHSSNAGTKRGKVWTHPDMVVAADPRRRASRDEPQRLHAVEIETQDGFDLRSIYQAHAQGRGADYTWVFGSKEPGVEHTDWDRIVETAEELSVGLVTFKTPGAFTTWTTHLDAVHLRPSPAERDVFLNHALGSKLRREHDL